VILSGCSATKARTAKPCAKKFQTAAAKPSFRPGQTAKYSTPSTKAVYRLRNLIERFFNGLKNSRRGRDTLVS